MKWVEYRSPGFDRLHSMAADGSRWQSPPVAPPTAYSLQPTACRRARAARGRAGFTLLEILVATTILMVIVLIVSMVFQQSNGAFQGGVRRVKDQTVLRGILGTIARELVMAVDSKHYPPIKNDFPADEGPEISFVALTGAPDEASGLRAPQMIKFKYSNKFVTRSVANISYKDGTWSAKWEPDAVTLNPDKEIDNFFFKVVHGQGGLPLRVDVEARLITSGEDSLVSARSAGADGEWETKDDIVVGGR